MVKDDVQGIGRLEIRDFSFHQNIVWLQFLEISFLFFTLKRPIVSIMNQGEEVLIDSPKNHQFHKDNKLRKLEQKYFTDKVKILLNHKPINTLVNSNIEG